MFTAMGAEIAFRNMRGLGIRNDPLFFLKGGWATQ